MKCAGGGVSQKKNLPLSCLANHHFHLYRVTMNKLVIILHIKLLFKRYIAKYIKYYNRDYISNPSTVETQ